MYAALVTHWRLGGYRRPYSIVDVLHIVLDYCHTSYLTLLYALVNVICSTLVVPHNTNKWELQAAHYSTSPLQQHTRAKEAVLATGVGPFELGPKLPVEKTVGGKTSHQKYTYLERQWIFVFEINSFSPSDNIGIVQQIWLVPSSSLIFNWLRCNFGK